MTNPKLRIAVSGVGNRALPKNPQTSNWLGWIELIRKSDRFELAAAHDVSRTALDRLVSRGCLDTARTFQSLDEMLDKTSCDALLVANPAEFHAGTIKKALEHGLHVLVEKPLVTNLADGRELLNGIEKKGLVVAIVQNWRSKDAGQVLHKAVQSGKIGRVGHVFFRYVRDRENPNLPPYLFKESYPLLYAMGIHHLDLLRYVLQDEFAGVSGHAFKPPWSLYESTTGLNLFLKTQKGATVVYTGTISSKNAAIAQECILIEGENGSLVNESQWLEPPVWFCPRNSKEKVNLTESIAPTTVAQQYDKADQAILANFYDSIVHGATPLCTARDGLRSVAALEASRLACERQEAVQFEEFAV